MEPREQAMTQSRQHIRPLPLGLQEFRDVIQEGCVYVDKTRNIHELLQAPKCPYFLARPRRFGKSLLISTLEALFQGKRELFTDLWIGREGRWDWSKKYSVIRLDMSLIPRGTAEELKEGLAAFMRKIIRKHDLPVDPRQHPATLLQEAIEELGQDNQVIVLIDEYDKPLIDHLGGRNAAHREQELEIAHANRDVLRDFYTVLKGMGGYLRLVFVTGVSKFSKVSIFSGLNNLTDLTLAQDCATLLGYTQQELETNFAPHLRQLADEQSLSIPETLTQIKQWYDGFRFSSRDIHVYNPFSTLLLLRHKEFRAHWFQTGTPSFLVHLIKRVDKPRPEGLVGAKVAETSFDSYELHKLPQNLLPLMVQTGYLTIKEYDSATRRYLLDYPNQEVREGFLENLLESLANLPKGQAVTEMDRLTDALAENDLEEFFVALRSVLAGVPYELHIALEKYYQSLFYLIHTLLGFRIQTEVSTNTGRIDAVIDLDNRTYVFEFKLEPGNPTPKKQLAEDSDGAERLKSPAAQAERAAELAEGHKELAQAALRQIKDKEYHEKYLGKNKPVTLVGCVFTVNDMQGRPVRQATAWVSEES
ncbi:MAG: AAA family ATPase [Myxococcota bacterium]